RARTVDRAGDVELHRLAAVAAVVRAKLAVSCHGDQITRAGTDRPEELGLDPGIAERGPGELAEQVGAVGAAGAGPAAELESRPEGDRDPGRRGGRERGQVGRGAVDPGQVGPET